MNAPVRLSDLTLSCDAATAAELVADWSWLDVEGQPFLVTLFGDVLLRNDAGAIGLLDTVGGTFRELAPSRDEFAWALEDAEFLEDCFLSGVAVRCLAKGLRPGAGECLSFIVPPVLGGRVEPENVEVTPLRAHHALMAQIHGQAQ